MTIIEQSILPKRSLNTLEDAIVTTDDFAAVIDGSTSKSTLPPLPNGKTGGQMAAEIVASVIRTMPADIDIHTFVDRVNAAFRKQYCALLLPLLSCSESELFSRLAAHPEDRWTCSLVLYSRHHHALWMIGDCQAMVCVNSFASLNPNNPEQSIPLNPSDSTESRSLYSVFTNEKPYESLLAAKRGDRIRELLSANKTTIESLRNHDLGRDAIIPEMVELMQHQNISYSVLDGFPVHWPSVRIIAPLISASSAQSAGTNQLILASDGYPRLFPSLSETESYLHHVLTEDPLMIHLHPATKAWMHGTDSFDDRSYLRLIL